MYRITSIVTRCCCQRPATVIGPFVLIALISLRRVSSYYSSNHVLDMSQYGLLRMHFCVTLNGSDFDCRINKIKSAENVVQKKQQHFCFGFVESANPFRWQFNFNLSIERVNNIL